MWRSKQNGSRDTDGAEDGGRAEDGAGAGGVVWRRGHWR